MLSVSIMEHIISPVYMLLTSCMGSISSGFWRLFCGSGRLVERRFFLSWSRWPLIIASTFGRCLEIKLVVSQGQEVKCLRLIALRKVLGPGLKQAPPTHYANSFLVLSTPMMPFAEGGSWKLMEDEVTLLVCGWRVDDLLFFLGEYPIIHYYSLFRWLSLCYSWSPSSHTLLIM